MTLSLPTLEGLGSIVVSLVILFALFVVVRTYLPPRSGWQRVVTLSILFAGGVVYCTAVPVRLSPGVIADPRGALLTLSVLYGGPLVGGLTLAAGEVHRAMIGGSGVYAGLIGNALATGVGLAGWWWQTRRIGSRQIRFPMLLACALGVTGTTMLAFLFIQPFQAGWSLLLSNGPAMALVQFGSVLLLGSMLRADFDMREVRRWLDFQQAALDAHALVARIDRRGRVYWVNDKLRHLSGRDVDDLADNADSLFGAGCHDPSRIAEMWRTLLSGTTWHGEIQNIAADGHPYVVDATIMPFIAPTGTVENIVFVATDVTERVETAKQLIEAKQTAESASHAKSDFLANMSHELRTPLNAITGFSDMLRQEVFGTLGNERYRAYARDINESARFLSNMIKDILDISRIETGPTPTTPEPLDVRGYAEDCLRMVKHRASDKNIALDVRIPEDAPRIQADGAHFKQILNNLLTNAVKYTPEGGTVSLSLDADTDTDAQAVIAVQDTGIGIPDEKLQEIREPFVQVRRNATQPTEGVGLGLYFVSQLVARNGGALDISSELNRGTTVRIAFPRAVSQGEAA
jgi:PAS domain S-box-containing protein